MSLSNLFRPAPLEVQKGEKIVEYDKANLKEYRKMQQAESVLAAANIKGMRKPSNKAIEAAKELIQDYRRKKAETFLEEHKARIAFYGVEIKAHFETLGNGLIKPSLTIADFNPFKETAPVQAWSEAMEENLATRIGCEHEINEDGTVCRKCALNPENWGVDNVGINEDYHAKQRERIETQKEIELACENGSHVLNDEAKNNPDAPMQFCVHCRKPKTEWVEEEVKQETPEEGESVDPADEAK